MIISIRKLLFVNFLLLSAFQSRSQDVYQSSRAGWLAKAEKYTPKLIETTKHPVSIVRLEKNKNAFQGWKTVFSGKTDSLYKGSFKKQKEVILDFGEHLTGYFSFKVDTLSRTPDAPLKFRLTFGEVPSEIATPFDPYKGDLSRGWLQDEVITVMDVPSVIKISRRLAFRYVKIELIGSSQYYDFKISNAECAAFTSVAKFPEPLLAGAGEMITQIDKVGLNTLKECMQTVYEDGPKRDRRLWIGDLFLESLANGYSFKNYDLTKRCLYLLAGLSDHKGDLVGTVFEKPEPHPQALQYLMDYNFLYNVTLKEYAIATGDKATANDLWPVAKRQLDVIRKFVKADGRMDYKKANKEWWLFFDWKADLHKEAALQGIAVYALKNTYQLATFLGKQDDVKDLPVLIARMTKAAKQYMYNNRTGLFFSGEAKQVSYASQIWMVLGGVLNKTESRATLKALQLSKDAVIPGAPYLYHFYIQSLIEAGMNAEAKLYLTNYWGGMVKKGADTFWEVYDPGNEYLSPYNFFPINSYCHAWSCTPVYFIRKYPDIFQR